MRPSEISGCLCTYLWSDLPSNPIFSTLSEQARLILPFSTSLSGGFSFFFYRSVLGSGPNFNTLFFPRAFFLVPFFFLLLYLPPQTSNRFPPLSSRLTRLLAALAVSLSREFSFFLLSCFLCFLFPSFCLFLANSSSMLSPHLSLFFQTMPSSPSKPLPFLPVPA